MSSEDLYWLFWAFVNSHNGPIDDILQLLGKPDIDGGEHERYRSYVYKTLPQPGPYLFLESDENRNLRAWKLK
jgi:hypothetical protein